MDLYLKHYESISLLWISRCAIGLWLIYFISIPIAVMNAFVFHKESTIQIIICGISMFTSFVAVAATVAVIAPVLFFIGLGSICLIILLPYLAEKTKPSTSAADD